VNKDVQKLLGLLLQRRSRSVA